MSKINITVLVLGAIMVVELILTNGEGGELGFVLFVMYGIYKAM